MVSSFTGASTDGLPGPAHVNTNRKAYSRTELGRLVPTRALAALSSGFRHCGWSCGSPLSSAATQALRPLSSLRKGHPCTAIAPSHRVARYTSQSALVVTIVSPERDSNQGLLLPTPVPPAVEGSSQYVRGGIGPGNQAKSPYQPARPSSFGLKSLPTHLQGSQPSFVVVDRRRGS